MYPSSDQLFRAAQRVAAAERIEIENKMLMVGLHPTDEEMEQIAALVDLAVLSGDTSAFLYAAVRLVQKPLFIPCSCWWCKLKRRVRRKGRRC